MPGLVVLAGAVDDDDAPLPGAALAAGVARLGARGPAGPGLPL